MKGMNPEIIKKELIDTFEFISELNRKPELLKKLPDRAVMLKKDEKRMFISTTKKPKIVML